MPMEAKISAINAYAPDRIIDNHFFEGKIDTSDEWIQSRTGIKTRRFTDEDEFTGDLCVGAAKKLMKDNNVDSSEIDFIIVATISQDQVMPSVASQVQGRLGIKGAGAIDLTAACAGFVYGLVVAQGLIKAGTHKKILVFGADTLSKFIDFKDRTTCILFGDGAGVGLVEAAEKSNILGAVTGTEGESGHCLYLSNNAESINQHPIIANNKIHQDGKSVFKWAVTTVARETKKLIDNSGLTIEDIDWFIPHSANMRIIEAICKYLDMSTEKALESITDFGNTSAASIPLAFEKGQMANKIKSGDKIVMIGFGGGLTYGGIIIEWP